MIASLPRYRVLAYLGLTFLISWGGILMLTVPLGFPATPETADALFPAALLLMLAGPLAAGVLLTAVLDGAAGFKRWAVWRVPVRWYAVALLFAPALVMAVLLPLMLVSPAFLPAVFGQDEPASLILTGFIVGVLAGFCEEPGWTGFLTPVLRKRHGVVASGLLVGVAWGIWHLLITWWGSGDESGAFSMQLFIAPFMFYALVLPVYRVLMVWVWDRTKSLPVVALMHGSLTGTTVFVLAPTAQGVELGLYYLVLAGALWTTIGIGAARRFYATKPRRPVARRG